MTIDDQFEIFYQRLITRKRNPTKPATQAAYTSYFKNWVSPEIGHLEVSTVENGVMKRLVATLVDANLAPASIAGITQLVKGIVASDIDENGNCRQIRVWNSEFIDSPILKTLNAPIISAEEVIRAISIAPDQYGPLFAFAAVSGARISEILAIKVGPQPVSSYWDPEQSKIVIQKALYRGVEQNTKTASGVREVDIPQTFNDYLIGYFREKRNDGDYLFGEGHKPLRVRTAYDIAEDCSVPGYHSFRRFRCTHLENIGVPRALAMWWTGHAEGKDVHDRYIRLDKDLKARRDWCEKAGLGFELPKDAKCQQLNIEELQLIA